jgi:hypothetical protein
MKLLVSVRSVEEALLAAEGADFIDQGAGPWRVGRPAIPTVRAIVRCAGMAAGAASATSAMCRCRGDRIGVSMRVSCGSTMWKVGIELPQARGALRTCRQRRPIVPVFIADKGLTGGRGYACAWGLVMADTYDKRGEPVRRCRWTNWAASSPRCAQ